MHKFTGKQGGGGTERERDGERGTKTDRVRKGGGGWSGKTEREDWKREGEKERQSEEKRRR